MEFKFKTDTLNDSYRVEFSMGHEVFGRWLMSEVGTKPEKINALLAKLEELQSRQDVEELIEGRDFSLTLTDDDAIVMANSLYVDGELPEGEDFSHYDSESVGECGIEDFEAMLQSWLEFVG